MHDRPANLISVRILYGQLVACDVFWCTCVCLIYIRGERRGTHACMHQIKLQIKLLEKDTWQPASGDTCWARSCWLTALQLASAMD